jgi:glucose uptake protein
MVLSPSLAWALMLLSMTCWGSWANTFKLTRGVRFELFYWDYAIGMAASAIVLAAVADSPAAGGAAFPASLVTASAAALGQAAAAGVVFNLANLLLVAAISMAGLAVAFPVSIGTALIVGTALTFFVDRKGSPLIIAAGVALRWLRSSAARRPTALRRREAPSRAKASSFAWSADC